MNLGLLALGGLAAYKFLGSSTASAGGGLFDQGQPAAGSGDGGFFGFGAGGGQVVGPGQVAVNALGVTVYGKPNEDALPPGNYFVDKNPLVLAYGGRVAQAVTTDQAARAKLDSIAAKYRVKGTSSKPRMGYTKKADGTGVFYVSHPGPKGSIPLETIKLAAGILPGWPKSSVYVYAPKQGFGDAVKDAAGRGLEAVKDEAVDYVKGKAGF